MAHPAELPPQPDAEYDVEIELIDSPDYTSVNVWTLNLMSKRYHLPSLLQDITPWIDDHGALTDRAWELLSNIKVTIDKQQVSAAILFDSAVVTAQSLLETQRKAAQSFGGKVLKFITGKFTDD